MGNVVRLVTIAAAVVAVVGWLWVARSHPRWRRVAVFPVSYGVHVLVFYVVVLLRVVPPISLNAWSSAIRLQGLVLVILLGLYVVQSRQWATLV